MPEAFTGSSHKSFWQEEVHLVPRAFLWLAVGSRLCSLGRFQRHCAPPGGPGPSPVRASAQPGEDVHPVYRWREMGGGHAGGRPRAPAGSLSGKLDASTIQTPPPPPQPSCI